MQFYQIQLREKHELNFDGLVQERRNSIANALELRLSCTNPYLVQERRKTIANALESRFSCSNPYSVQERRNSNANALELRLSCTNPSIWNWCFQMLWHISQGPMSSLYSRSCDSGSTHHVSIALWGTCHEQTGWRQAPRQLMPWAPAQLKDANTLCSSTIKQGPSN